VIGGNTVYSGGVLTVDEPLPHPLPNPDYVVDNVAWTWTGNADFVGSQEISISVTGSPLLLAESVAYDPYGYVNDFSGFFSANIANVLFYDPFSDEKLDGVPQPGPLNPATPGQWWWVIPAGGTFTATMHVAHGSTYPETPDPPPPDPVGYLKPCTSRVFFG
jgi:hypothetical protein